MRYQDGKPKFNDRMGIGANLRVIPRSHFLTRFRAKKERDRSCARKHLVSAQELTISLLG